MKTVIIANWKMNPTTLEDAKHLLQASRKSIEKLRGSSLVLAVPTVFLHSLANSYRGTRIAFGAQNIHTEPGGSFTGEVSISQVKDAGATHVIIGHAERRALGETDEDVQKKVQAVFSSRMIPIICVGEKARDALGEHLQFVKKQLKTALADVPAQKLGKLIIAYEPVWAIGADTAMKPHDMHEMSIFIRKTLFDIYGKPGLSVKILYGGSIDESNAVDMLREGDVQGLLVGRASADPIRFTHLLNALAKA